MQIVWALDDLEGCPNEMFMGRTGAGEPSGPIAGKSAMEQVELNESSGIFCFLEEKLCKMSMKADVRSLRQRRVTCCRMAKNSVRRSERKQKSCGMQEGWSARHLAQQRESCIRDEKA
jgi:hypothetical protein